MVTDREVEAVVSRLVTAAQPERVVLFGSLARGDANNASDLDLLVVQQTDLPRHRRSIPLYRAVREFTFPIDITVYTPQELAEDAALPMSFTTTALREGRVVYEKPC